MMIQVMSWKFLKGKPSIGVSINVLTFTCSGGVKTGKTHRKCWTSVNLQDSPFYENAIQSLVSHHLPCENSGYLDGHSRFVGLA